MEYIEGVVYINLKHRSDRNNSILDNLRKYDFDMNNVHRVEGILHELCGHIGCGKSHIEAIKLAIKNDWRYVMILEDDFSFGCEKSDLINKLKQIKSINWDVIMLTGANKITVKSKYNFLEKVKRCTVAAGYIIRKHYYQTLLDNFEESVNLMEKELLMHINKCNNNNISVTKLHYCSAIDQNWIKLQEKDIFYLLNPFLGNQNYDNSYSDNNCSIEYQRTIINNV